MSNADLNKVIEEFSLLPLGDKEYVVAIVGKQLIDAKRDAIARRAKRAMSNLRRRTVKKGTVKDLYKDLEIDQDNLG
jgi:hypothetical protein